MEDLRISQLEAEVARFHGAVNEARALAIKGWRMHYYSQFLDTGSPTFDEALEEMVEAQFPPWLIEGIKAGGVWE